MIFLNEKIKNPNKIFIKKNNGDIKVKNLYLKCLNISEQIIKQIMHFV